MTNTLVTGCNRGIGLELCRQLSARGDDVIAACRHASPELAALDVRVMEGVNVALDADLERLAKDLDGQTIDILINNAGILRSDTFESLNYDDMIEQYQVNALGPLKVTRALSENLRPGSKVAIISSRVGSIEDNQSGSNYGYRVSKAAVNMVGANLKFDLGKRDIAVALLHPGLVATDMTGGNGVSPEHSAAGLIERIEELDMSSSGGFWHAEGERLPW